MRNNKARKYTSPILEQLMSEITPEEMKATEQKMLQELNKQSSIEWLIDQLEKWELYSKISFQCLKEIEQAKEMERELIKESCIMAIMKWNEIWYDHKIEGADIWAEDYCKELFGE